MDPGDGALVGMNVLGRGLVPDDEIDSPDEEVDSDVAEDEQRSSDETPGPWLLLVTAKVGSCHLPHVRRR